MKPLGVSNTGSIGRVARQWLQNNDEVVRAAPAIYADEVSPFTMLEDFCLAEMVSTCLSSKRIQGITYEGFQASSRSWVEQPYSRCHQHGVHAFGYKE